MEWPLTKRAPLCEREVERALHMELPGEAFQESPLLPADFRVHLTPTVCTPTAQFRYQPHHRSLHGESAVHTRSLQEACASSEIHTGLGPPTPCPPLLGVGTQTLWSCLQAPCTEGCPQGSEEPDPGCGGASGFRREGHVLWLFGACYEAFQCPSDMAELVTS